MWTKRQPRSKKEIRAKAVMELDFWTQLEDFLRTTQSKLFKSLADAKDVISNLVDANSRRQYHVPKKKLEECLSAFVIMFSSTGQGRRRQFRPTRAQTRGDSLAASPALSEEELQEIKERGGVGRRSSAPAPPIGELTSPHALNAHIDRLNEMKISPRWQRRRVSGPQTLETLASMKLALRVHAETTQEDIMVPSDEQEQNENEET